MTKKELNNKKILRITVEDPNFHDYKPDYDFPTAKPPVPTVKYKDCNYILDHIKEYVEIENVIDNLISYMYHKAGAELIIDLKEWNKKYQPAKEMTVEDIERELGYKVKIVKEKRNND